MLLNYGMVYGLFMKIMYFEDDFLVRIFEDSCYIFLNNSQIGMLIVYFKDDLILWDKELKDNINS